MIRRTYVNGTMENAAKRDESEPAPTILFGHNMNRVEWREWGGEGPSTAERPATTVVADPRLSSPNHHNEGEQNSNAIRVSIEEAATLQSFPPEHPWQGSRTAIFTQIGNAVPPLMARAILEALTPTHTGGERK